MSHRRAGRLGLFLVGLGLSVLMLCAPALAASQATPGVVTGSTNWALGDSLTTGTPTTTFTYGTRPLVPIMGDWDGDGTRTPGTSERGVFRLSDTIPPGAPTITFTFGDPRGFPVVGDFNGDGFDDVAVFRNGTWEVRIEAGGVGTEGVVSTYAFSFGSGSWPGTVPVAGDWDGDGTDGIGTYVAGIWTLRQTANALGMNLPSFTYNPGTSPYPIAGDWNADGTDSVGVKAGTSWLLNNANDSGPPDISFDFGLANDFPLVGAVPPPVVDPLTAVDDTFDGAKSAVGNTALVVDAPGDGPPAVGGPKKSVTGDLLANDINATTVVPGTFPATDGGSVTIESDGDFVFTPAAGCSDTSASFDYTVTDGTASDVGTVTIAITGCVWYASNNAPGNAGTSTAPFDTLAQAQTASGSGDTIFVFDGDNTTSGYNSGIDLKANQRLIGEAATLQIGADVLLTGDPAKRPTITDNNADVVSLASGNTVRGIQIDPSGNGGGIAGGAGDAGGTIDDVRIIDTGAPGTQPGLELDGTSGTFDISGLTIDSTPASSSASGVRLNNNSGRVNFSRLDIDTTTGAGLDATSSGTLVVSGSGNTIDTTTGRALSVTNTTIGADDLTFQRIASNGATNGIVLNNTGAAGRLAVTGNGGTCTTADTSGCSGGRIRNSTGGDDSSQTPGGTGIVLRNTTAPSLTRMWLHDHSNYAIRGHGIAGFTLANSVINGTNGTTGTTPFDDGSVILDNLTGSASVSGSAISGGYENNVRVNNTAGSLDRITFSSSTIGLNSAAGGNDGIGLQSSPTAGALKATVQNSTFTGAAGDLIDYQHNGTGSGDLVLTDNAFSNNHPAIATGGGGLTLSNNGMSGNTTMNISANTFRDAVGSAVLVVKTTGPSTQSGTFSDNRIGVAGTANSGSREGSGLILQTVGQGTLDWTVANNQIRGFNNHGVEVLAGGGATAQGGTVNTTITGNTIAEPGNTGGTQGISKNGIHLNIGTVPGDTYRACAVIGGPGALANSLAASGKDGVPATGIGDIDVRLRQRQSTTIRLPGYGGAPTDTTAVESFVAGNNPTGGPVVFAQASGSGGGFTGGAPPSCP